LQNDGQAQGSVVDGEYFISIDNGGSNIYDVQLIQESFPIINGKTYLFEFDARADANRIMEPRVAQNGGSFIVYSKTGPVLISSTPKHFEYEFEMTDPTDYNARVVLNFGTSDIDCYVDNVSVKEVLPNSVENNTSPVPDQFMLYRNYPNPFNPSTAIIYQLPQSGENYFVTLTVFDLLGRKIADLVSDEQTAGKYTVQWDASGYVGGVYFCELKVLGSNGIQIYNKVNKIMYLK